MLKKILQYMLRNIIKFIELFSNTKSMKYNLNVFRKIFLIDEKKDVFIILKVEGSENPGFEFCSYFQSFFNLSREETKFILKVLCILYFMAV